jgi:hypothetical protein
MGSVSGKIWTAAEVKEELKTKNSWLCHGIVAIYQRQTADEQAAETTIENNGVGFNGCDGEFLSSVAKQLLAGRKLSERQVTVCRKAMLKYAGQLSKIANHQL